jgi:glycosyltransferase involved in cell wall biosynthesis
MNKIKVQMKPHPTIYENSRHESGIRRVVEQYAKYFSKFNIELVSPQDQNYDIRAIHAGSADGRCDVLFNHGLYWSDDYHASAWEHGANASIVELARKAKQITVPSTWVAETFRRDMRLNPTVIPHGIDYWDWDPKREHQGYVLWNKNRDSDVCTPQPMYDLARMNSEIRFVTTKSPKRLGNISIIGVVPHAKMKQYLEYCMVYLSTTKETFGIGVLEAMAAGVPVLGFDWGGNRELVKHGVNGYLARINDMQDLNRGLHYCIKYRDQLGANGREMVKEYTWEKSVEIVRGVFEKAMAPDDYGVTIVIPSHNYANVLQRAVDSAFEQSYKPEEVIVVNDRSTDNTEDVCKILAEKYDNFRWVSVDYGNVADTRNHGINMANTELICCLDADDKIEPKFLEACIEEGFKKDRSLGIAYTKLIAVQPDGRRVKTDWPDECDYDKQFAARGQNNLRGLNQIPTCNVFKKEAWRRTGGFKKRYAPLGAGAEDAEFWTRVMSIGYGAKKISDAGLFIYSHRTGMVSGAKNQDPNLIEPHWLRAHPWALDHKHPFASRATPKEGRKVHLVRQYDQPMFSFVVPVGPGHEELVEDAIESVESQTLRRWELIVVWDSPVEPTQRFLDAYPFARLIQTGGEKGAGYARNRGAEIARAEFLVFLDADDRIDPGFLEKSLAAWNETQAIVYTDYYNSVITDQKGLEDFDPGKVAHYNTATQEAFISGRSADYDCFRAVKQPERGKLFHWCLMTCLIPKEWHDAIGGFDESMESFEDVLYHWVMAKSGYCYTRLPEPLVVYRMYTGRRREKASIYTPEGREIAKNMLEYSEQVLKGIDMAGCSGCNKNRVSPTAAHSITSEENQAQVDVQRMQDENYAQCEYVHPNKGAHHIYGQGKGIYYGRKGGGSVFLVHKADIAAQPHLFKPIAVSRANNVNMPRKKVEEPAPPPELELFEELPPEELETVEDPVVAEAEDAPFEIEEERVFDIAALPGVTPGILEQFEAMGISTKEDIQALGVEGLVKIKGIAETRAEILLDYLVDK